MCVCVSEQLTFSGGGGGGHVCILDVLYCLFQSLARVCGRGGCLHIGCFILSLWQDPLGAEGGNVGGWVKWGGGGGR